MTKTLTAMAILAFVSVAGLMIQPAVSQGVGPDAATVPATQPAAPKMDIRYIIIHKPGPKWKLDTDIMDQPGIGDHVAHWGKLNRQGKLAMGGPFLDGSGGLMIPAAGMTKKEIEQFAQQDPAVKSGLLTFEVKPWLVAMKTPATNPSSQPAK